MEARLNLKPCKYCGGTGVIETQPFCPMDYSYFRALPDFIHGDTLYAVRCSCCGMSSAPMYDIEGAVKSWNSGEAELD